MTAMSLGRFFISFVVAAGLVGGISPAAAISQEEAAAKVAEEYGVEVLKTDAVLQGNQPIILLTVMQPGGNDNAAFQVNTIAVDAKTGKVIPGARRLETGRVTTSEAPAAAIEDRSPSVPWGRVPR